MTPLQDYVYRFSRDHLHMSGRCRVRIYKRQDRARTVLLTELHDNSGESIASACEQIVTDLAERWKLSPHNTRWLHHDATLENAAPQFDELKFIWNDDRTVTEAKWQRLSDEQVEALTGESLKALDRRIGDTGY